MNDEPRQESQQESGAESSQQGSDDPLIRPHWRKTQEGKWVICGPQEIMKPGARVEVFRRDGSSSINIIANNPEAIGNPFENRDKPDVMMVYVHEFSEEK